MYTYDRHKNVTEKILLEVKSNAGMSNHSGWEDKNAYSSTIEVNPSMLYTVLFGL